MSALRKSRESSAKFRVMTFLFAKFPNPSKYPCILLFSSILINESEIILNKKGEIESPYLSPFYIGSKELFAHLYLYKFYHCIIIV
jgi:hypothetical protein